jgi:anti-sigma regulatory factor (Ser/Thr protein kinase)
MKKNFSISPRILSHLGEDLIRNESIALLELVKNSYDSCSSICKVNFLLDKVDNLLKITLEDDGFGMDKSIIENVWLNIGTDFKYKKIEPNICGRIPLGEKGIGRFGMHKLGNKITLISKKKNQKEVSVFIDWEELNDAENLDDFQIEFSENSLPKYFKNKTGTLIEIEKLKTEWDSKQLREVYRALTSLNSPFDKKNESFIVQVTSNSDIFKGLPSFSDIRESALYYGKCKMEEDEIKEFRYEFRPWKSLFKIDSGRIKTHKQLLKKELRIINESKETINLESNGIGPIEFEILIFEKDAQIFNYVNIEKKSILNYLNENGGVRVYRDGIRVYDYGEKDNDWLGIDLKRISSVGSRVSKSILIGAVKISRKASSGLKEKTNREGFIENESYKAFKSAVNYCLGLIVKERNVDKQRLTTLYKKHKVIEPVLSDLDEATQLVEEKLDPGKTKDELMKYLIRIGIQYKQVKEILIKSANAGLNLSVVIHEIEKLVSELVNFVERKQFDRALNISKILENIVQGYTAMIKNSSIKDVKLSDIVVNALKNYEYRFTDHKIEIISNHENNILKGKLALSEAISVLTNLLDNSIYWLSYARESDRKISVYITDKIENFNSIIVSDNGPGFNIPTDVAIEPFITGKPHNIGSGLGLHIANEMMKSMNGQLLFLDKSDIDFPQKIKTNKINKAIISLCFLRPS